MKQTFRILAPLALVTLFAVGLGSCSDQSTIAATTTGAPAPVNEVDVMINGYEKVTTEYLRVARRFKGGDLSVTVVYLDQGRQVREEAAKLQQTSGKMTPPQAQRVAAISAKSAPYLQK